MPTGYVQAAVADTTISPHTVTLSLAGASVGGGAIAMASIAKALLTNTFTATGSSSWGGSSGALGASDPAFAANHAFYFVSGQRTLTAGDIASGVTLVATGAAGTGGAFSGSVLAWWNPGSGMVGGGLVSATTSLAFANGTSGGGFATAAIPAGVTRAPGDQIWALFAPCSATGGSSITVPAFGQTDFLVNSATVPQAAILRFHPGVTSVGIALSGAAYFAVTVLVFSPNTSVLVSQTPDQLSSQIDTGLIFQAGIVHQTPDQVPLAGATANDHGNPLFGVGPVGGGVQVT